MRSLKALMLSCGLLLSATAADAHTPFMKPVNFHPNTEWTSAQAGYSTQIFCPNVGISGPDLTVIAPDGRRLAFSSVQVSQYETALETALPLAGTYRLTTGEVMGPVERMIYQRGRWRALRANETPPRRTRISTMQMVEVAESYVTRGEATRAAIEPVVGTLAIRPITHPNQVTAASGADLQLLFNGAPFARMPFVVYERGDSEDDMHRAFVTNSEGRAHLTFDHPGLYLIAVRYRPEMPAGASVDVRSYSTTLTLEVTQ
ncbi:MAG: DUF4198 domain-containing protein [Hyphomonadaceae bacterium]|nr:DUF4198 domain-containing protein [Hyphomonadaceae bacterium]